MKKYIYIGLAVLAGIAVSLFLLTRDGVKPLNVNDLGSDPAAYSGSIAITGITAGISQYDATIFGIMDKKELQCTSANCNKLILPVKFAGKVPVVGDEVTVTGSFVSTPGGYVFAADTVKVLKHHKIGG